jgi:hypothetical protein
MLVGQVAQQHLQPKARAKVAEIAAKFFRKNIAYNSLNLCCWMDDVREQHQEYSTWHYITIGVNQEIPTPTPNVVEAIERARRVLQGETDPLIDSPDKALLILMHCVGDIHQPLHAASYVWTESDLAEMKKPPKYEDDHGGNGWKAPQITDRTPYGSGRYNFHGFWDAAYRVVWRGENDIGFEPLSDDGEKANHDSSLIPAFAEKLVPADSLEPGELDPRRWAQESNEWAKKVAYEVTKEFPKGDPTIKFSQDYVEKARILAQKRIQMAGLRLAALLNQIYPE